MIRFGPYEINLESGDLRKFGYRIKLQPKSFLVLQALLEAPGEMVTREELKTRLWPENTFVEFEASLNVAVRRLREALSDEAQTPTYIETVPKHGYRFIGTVELVPIAPSVSLRPELVPIAGHSAAELGLTPAVTQVPPQRGLWMIVPAVALLICWQLEFSGGDAVRSPLERRLRRRSRYFRSQI